MARRGPKRQLEVESAFWRLLGGGVGPVDAAARVGIGRKTGYRWRAETGGIAPAVLAEEARTTRYLSRLERHRVATLRRDGVGVREIARQLVRAPSTISRELKRNTAAHDRRYDGDLAHSRARCRARRPRATRLAADPVLAALVHAKLELEWSPEQIAAYLRATFPDRAAWHLCHESIYQALYGGKAGLARTLTVRLRTGRPLRRTRRSPEHRSPRYIAPGQLIDARPAVVTERTRVGDWESQ